MSLAFREQLNFLRKTVNGIIREFEISRAGIRTAESVAQNKNRAWQEKCKQDQFSNRTLVFLFYVLDKTSNLNRLTAVDKWADLLHKIFGVSPKGMKNELDLI